MPHHRETRIVPYTAEEMFAVVADVERYPDFLPWCASLTVLKREEKEGARVLDAGMAVAYRGLSEHYVSRVTLDERARTVEATHIEGPFRRLDTHWRFVPKGGGCEVHFAIDFAFKSALLSAVANVAFALVARRMAEAFVSRAETLYGGTRMAGPAGAAGN